MREQLNKGRAVHGEVRMWALLSSVFKYGRYQTNSRQRWLLGETRSPFDGFLFVVSSGGTEIINKASWISTQIVFQPQSLPPFVN